MKENIPELLQRLQAIINTAIDGIITINSLGMIESINPAGARMFGYDAEELIGQNISLLMPDPYRSEHDGYIQSYIRTRHAKIIGVGREVTAQRKDGTIFPFRLAVNEVILNDRVIFTGIIHDLSEVKEAEAKLKAINEDLEMMVEKRTNELEEVVNRLLSTNSQLQENEQRLKESLDKEKELNELKSRFVSMASHEFRTPLSTIVSSAALISRYNSSDQDSKRQKHVKRIKSAVANLTGILNDFLSLSKLEEGKVGLITSTFKISDLCQEVGEEVQGLLKEGQCILHDHSGTEEFASDQRILKNVLFNIISNAIKYSGPGSTIRLESECINEELDLTISDEGIGIPENEQKYLFNRFFRASNVETIQGTGLGLNIVKEYVELLSGTVKFKSESGVGTTFYITVPQIK